MPTHSEDRPRGLDRPRRGALSVADRLAPVEVLSRVLGHPRRGGPRKDSSFNARLTGHHIATTAAVMTRSTDTRCGTHEARSAAPNCPCTICAARRAAAAPVLSVRACFSVSSGLASRDGEREYSRPYLAGARRCSLRGSGDTSTFGLGRAPVRLQTVKSSVTWPPHLTHWTGSVIGSASDTRQAYTRACRVSSARRVRQTETLPVAARIVAGTATTPCLGRRLRRRPFLVSQKRYYSHASSGYASRRKAFTERSRKTLARSSKS